MVACDKDNDDKPNSTVNWVDLGLPSGLLWAECNLGANAPEEYGNYYAWGETQPKEAYIWRTYRYCTVYADRGNLHTLTKYNTNSKYGTPDNLTTLETMDDAATATLGSGARMPTADEWDELINNTTVEWTTLNGVNGCKFTAANGNTLFLSATGYLFGSELLGDGFLGAYWSSSLSADAPYAAFGFDFGSDNQHLYASLRYCGSPVRAVRSAGQK